MIFTLLRKSYAYSDWGLSQDIGETAEEHFPTCIAVCFWEHIPTYKPARDDMPRWLSFEYIMANQHWFKYSLSDEEFEELKELYSNVKGSQ